MGLEVGSRVYFSQVSHSVPVDIGGTAIPIHEAPQQGQGTIVLAWKVEQELHLIVLPDSQLEKKEKITLLLRVPPDHAEFIG